MKLSIITPSYNQGQFIEQTILSVINQPVEDLEYWVIDGGSSDTTLSFLEKYQNRIHWVSEMDNGQTEALNKGIRLSSGDIFGWLNSDDIYYPNVLEQVLDFFAEHPTVNIIYGKANHIDVKGEIINAYPTQEWNYADLFDSCFICQPAVFFRRNIIEKYGFFDEALHFCMDYEYWLRVGAKEEMVFFPELLAGSRLYATNKTFGCRRQAHEEAVHMIYQKTGAPSLRWCIVLGIVEAEELGLSRKGIVREARFIAAVYKVICREYRRMGRAFSFKDMSVLAWLWVLSHGKKISRQLRGRTQ